jgi:hypothetical protein
MDQPSRDVWGEGQPDVDLDVGALGARQGYWKKRRRASCDKERVGRTEKL